MKVQEQGTRMAPHQQLWQLSADQSIHESPASIYFQHCSSLNIFFQITLGVGLKRKIFFLLAWDTKTADTVRAAAA